MATAQSRAKAIIEAITDKTLPSGKVASVIKGYMNFPQGTNEEVATLFIDQLDTQIRSVVRAHNEQKQLDTDRNSAIAAGDNAMVDFEV